MKRRRKIYYWLYALVVITSLILIGTEDQCHAGRIRTLILRPDQPGKIYLALGESTDISFPSKPEKLVPGSPTKAVIEFINNTDISVSPTASRNLGNLIVFTKAGRFVILFESGTPNNYDDIVNVRYFSQGSSLRLNDDSYHVETLKMTLEGRAKGSKEIKAQINALFSSGDKKISGPEIFSTLVDVNSTKCAGCVLLKKAQDPQFVCSVPISTLTCENSKFSKIKIMREGK